MKSQLIDRAARLEHEVARFRDGMDQVLRTDRPRHSPESFLAVAKAVSGQVYPSSGNVYPIVFTDPDGTQLSQEPRVCYNLTGTRPDQGTAVLVWTNGKQWYSQVPGEMDSGGGIEYVTGTSGELVQVRVDYPSRHMHTVWRWQDLFLVSLSLNPYGGDHGGAAIIIHNLSVPRGATITSTNFSFAAFDRNEPYHEFVVSIRAVVTQLPEHVWRSEFSDSELGETEVIWDQSGITWHFGEVITLPDLSAVVQEVIDRDEWVRGSSDLVLFLRVIEGGNDLYWRRMLRNDAYETTEVRYTNP